MSSGSSKQATFWTEKAATKWLLDLVDYERHPPGGKEPTRHFHLERFADLLGALNSPQEAFPSIHVAGTSGKGWVCSALAAICQAAGLKTGLYTSPHLKTFRERIQINGEMISARDFARGVSELGPRFQAAENEMGFRTVFEILTALAFQTFAEAKVDVAIVETGLGGRLDCTNVLQPALSIITSIGWDHMAILGNTIESITHEKAGIIKAGVPIIVAQQTPDVRSAVMREIRQVASEKHSRVIEADRKIKLSVERESLRGAAYQAEFAGGELAVRWRKFGHSAEINLKTILAAVEQLRKQGFDLPDRAIRKGLSTWRWPGRLDVVASKPAIILDGAHNSNSGAALREALDRVVPGKKICWVIGMLRDKDISAVLRILLGKEDTLIATSAPSPRGATAADVASAAENLCEAVYCQPNLEKTVKEAVRLSGPRGIVCIAGSLYLVGPSEDAVKKMQ